MSELALNLLSGLLGALVGALATLRAAQWQLRQIAQNHANALDHQNAILEKTFDGQRALQAAQLRLTAQVQFLQHLFDVFANAATPVYLTGHQLRNDWVSQIFISGNEAFSSDVASFRDRASAATRLFASEIDANRHHASIAGAFDSTLKFQARFFEPIQQFIQAIAKLPPNANRDTISLLNAEGQKFSQAVDVFGEWIESSKKMCVAGQSRLLEGKEFEVTA